MKNLQKELRNKKFSYDQYFSIGYTIVFPDKTERDYYSIVKARSNQLAKDILIKKIKDDHEGSKVKSIQSFILRKDGKIKRIKIDMEDWEHIRNCAFPNLANNLFKTFKERPKGYISRLNKTIPTGGFKFAKNNKYKKRKNNLTEEQKSYMKRVNHKWVPWPTSERNAFKQKIILALTLNNNCRTDAAKHLGVGTRTLYSLMKRIIEIDWKKEYPPPKPIPPQNQNKLSKEARARRIKKSWATRWDRLYEQISPRVIKMHKEGFTAHQIRTRLGHGKPTIEKVINRYESKR
jgi:transposase